MRMLRAAIALAACLAAAGAARADVKLPAIFGDHMVLQRDREVKVWGRAEPGEEVRVEFRGESRSARAGADGSWSLMLPPSAAGGPFEMVVAGKSTITLRDVLVGEVWLASGQSNMHWEVADSADADLEIAAADHPGIRLISVPTLGTQEPQEDFKGEWKACTPGSIKGFSAVAYFFGRQLHETLGVPVGLVRSTWSNSPCEAWLPRDAFDAGTGYKGLVDEWAAREKAFAEARAKGAPPADLAAQMEENTRPGNLFAGMIRPVLGYTIRGVIWYQGEGNALRAHEYHELFPLLIRSWRERWGQGDFPFYWVQISDFMPEKPEPADSAWAELREAQTATLRKEPNVGEAVAIDLGEAREIHPRRKQEVGRRLARLALARDYGVDVAYKSPSFRSMEVQGDRVVAAFDDVGKGLRAADVEEVRGFAVAGADGVFSWASAKLLGPDKVEVRSDAVARPVAVRYAWADNPVCNLYSDAGLPLTPFRTDDWQGVTTMSKPRRALRLLASKLPTIAKWGGAAVAGVFALSLLGAFPWSRINSRSTDVDLATGRTRTTRHLFGLPVRRSVAETAVSRALAAEDRAGAKARWRRALTYSPRVRYSPHHDFYDAPAALDALAARWEAEATPPEARRAEALELLRGWREAGRA